MMRIQIRPILCLLLAAVACIHGKYHLPVTSTVDPCNGLSDDECERLLEQTTTNRQGQERNLLVDSKGTLNILVIPIKWSDTPADRTLPSVDALDELWNGVGVSDNIPSGSIANYTNANSHGNLKLSATVVDWIEADNTELYYAAGRSGIPNGNMPGTVQFEDVIVHALEQLDASGFDFMPFDQDNDVVIDAVAILHSGYAAELGAADCSNGRGRLDRIQSHYAKAGTPKHFGGYGHMLSSYIVASAFIGSCNANMARLGIIMHETIHLFGMPELYDVGGAYSDSGCCVGGIGGYDIMALPFGQGHRLGWPGHLSPWTKYALGWITPMQITSDGTYTLRPSELFPDVYMISSPYPDGEYLLLEVRRPLLFDSNLWEPGGLLIYHVDENAPGPGNQVRGFPGQNGWPGNGNHYRVALMQRDGQYNLEKAYDNGHIEDFWLPGENLALGPGNGEKVADSASYPNTDSYAFGDIKVTGLTITNFEDNDGDTVSFEVIGMPGGSNPPPPTGPPPTSSPTIAPIVPTPAPVVPTPAPVIPTSAPVVPETPAPVILTPAPVTPTPAPVVPQTPAPIEPPTEVPVPPPTVVPKTPAPVVPTKAPIVPTIAPVTPTVTPTRGPVAAMEPSTTTSPPSSSTGSSPTSATFHPAAIPDDNDDPLIPSDKDIDNSKELIDSETSENPPQEEEGENSGNNPGNPETPLLPDDLLTDETSTRSGSSAIAARDMSLSLAIILFGGMRLLQN